MRKLALSTTLATALGISTAAGALEENHMSLYTNASSRNATASNTSKRANSK